ncbi:PREDICTED: complement component C1q receptor [Ceratotherium simum simum]|uniref:Complement component C1q receptor n=1 Tax=Ceratotherium simum simum TaxID=73337 RepID=A0ABM1DJB6_CERSS|nr:PREDICTED: complement component C1q receptor [Ceratotherium simum simum]
MATSTRLLLLLLLGQRWLGAGAEREAAVCAGTACYTAHWNKLSAGEAQNHCSRNGGNLATVKTEEEARHVQRALAQLLQLEAPPAARTGKFWIGLQREKGKCLDPSLPLKGFSWMGGGENTSYANWYKELKHSCISKRCVSLVLDLSLTPLTGHLPKWAEGPCGSPSSPGSNIEGFVCKFSFKGMCRPLALGGPGHVNYTTPFQATSSSLDAVPFASVANVACGDGRESGHHYFLCKEKAPDVFDWGSSGPLCVSPKYGCDFNNGGCQQDCFEGGDGSFRCGCRPGFRLLDDLVTCASRNPCSSSPCGGAATCVPGPLGKNYMCRCPPGYQLDSTQQDCVDVDECQDSPCAQECVNTPGGFHCQCWVGYEPGGAGEGACRDMDECAPGRSPCAQGCTNTDGSFFCSCEEGYVLAGDDGTQCKDVDECEGRVCDSLCFNVQGSFRCGCLPGWELAPDGVSCTMGATTLGPPAGPPQGDGTGDKEGNLVPSATMSSPTRDPEGTSKVAPTVSRPSLPPDAPITPAPPKTLAPSGPPGVWMEPSTHHPSATTGHRESMGGDFVAKQSDDGTDGQKLLLFYILGTVVAILLLLALALGLLVYRKRRAKREEIKEKKPQSATDSYAWVPERAESRAMENQYR